MNNESMPAAVNGRWAGYRAIVAKNLLEIWREPETIFWIFVFPLLLSLGLGLAFRNKPADSSPVALVASPEAQRILPLLPADKGVRPSLVDSNTAREGFRLGRYDLVVTVDGGDSVHYLYDPGRAESDTARRQFDDLLQRAQGRRDAVSTTSESSSEPGSRYIDFLIPGLLGMSLMNSSMWGIGFALVEMRQRKLLKRFLATPMRRSDFLLAMATGRLLLMLVELAVLLGFGVLIFHIRIAGSLPAILLVNLAGALGFGGIGLLTACRAQKIETASGLINMVMMPMYIFSGTFFSAARFPQWMQPLVEALPLTPLNEALRAVILQGAPLSAQMGRLTILLLWGVASFALALRLFRWN
jgi:ABC transporter DrrB family efflux protein